MLSGSEIAAILRGIDEFSDDLKKRVKENEVVAQGAQTLLHRYKAMHTCKFANAKISSALHPFGWVNTKHSRELPYSGKLSREKTFANWWKYDFRGENFRAFAMPKDATPQISRRKFSRIAREIRESFLPWKFYAIRYFRRGRQIPAQAAGRGRGGSKGNTSGRPAGMTVARFPASRYTMCARRPPKGKRIHSLTKNIAEGLQNGGKW